MPQLFVSQPFEEKEKKDDLPPKAPQFEEKEKKDDVPPKAVPLSAVELPKGISCHLKNLFVEHIW